MLVIWANPTIAYGHPTYSRTPSPLISATRVFSPFDLSSPGEEVDGCRWQWSWVDLPHAVDLAKGLGRER